MSIGQHAWHLGVGDPNALGWSITAGYLVTAVFCYLRSRLHAGLGALRHARFWFMIGLFLLLIGFNKQLDLQTLFLQLAKAFTLEHGLYQYRHGLIIAFIGALVLWGAASQVWLYSNMTRLRRPEKQALLGLGILFVFIAARAAYFQHLIQIEHGALLAQRAYWLMEIAAIACISTAAYCRGWRLRVPHADFMGVQGKIKHPLSP